METCASNVAGAKDLRVGVDVGGTKIEAVLVDADGVVLASARVPARPGGAEVVEDVAALVPRVAGARAGEVRSVGVGIPGLVHHRTGLVENVVNLGIERLELGERASAALGLPVQVDNDVNVAALGAYGTLPAASRRGRMAFVNLGTGLAAGLVHDGVLEHGDTGALGEIGHLPVDPNRMPCPCGQRGCLETACSGGGMRRMWPAADPPLPDILAKAARGDAAATRVRGIVLHALADVVQIIAQTADPSVIVIGGGVAHAGTPLLDALRGELRGREADSGFIASLGLPERLRLVDPSVPIGAIGAALIAR
ncbi:ROK family protein [Bifidobacterium sp. CP2]|uniref:ROK family protein n=1 Tax=Bifidobacterium sp. CP2 TaxID=2809025 RepID=UPI001BDD7D28|nr:ROK family protein [Bifidobacterium sp. CP2]MBT1181592.1 ROK family protein [Bifidobacterium sp. CP2]